MDEKGYSWMEAMLTLTILVVIFGTLLPVATNMTAVLHNKKQSMHASEIAYQGAIIHNAYGITKGTRSFEGADFDWNVTGKSICVSYPVANKVATKCLDY